MIAPLVVIGVVLGSIYAGVTGITEAAGMGVVAVLVIALFRGEMSWSLISDSLLRTVKSTGTIIWITIGATTLAGAYTIAGGPTYVAELILGADLPTMGIILVMMFIFLVLGAFMDWVGIVLLVMPVFLPIVTQLPDRGDRLDRQRARQLHPGLVRRRLLHEHAGQLPQPALRPGRLLPQIRGACRHRADRHLPRLPAVHLHPACWR